MNIQVEEIHRARYVVRGKELPCSLWMHHSYTIEIFREALLHRHD